MDYPQELYQGWDPAGAQADWEAKGKDYNALAQARGMGGGGGDDSYAGIFEMLGLGGDQPTTQTSQAITVPEEFVGKSLKQIQSEGNMIGRPDLIAQMMGISETDPLQADKTYNITADPGSAEYEFFSTKLGAQAGVAGDSNGELVPFEFDWEQGEADALEKLRPYYEEVLAESKGDVELAKKRMEEDYQQGKRFRSEDLSVAEKGFDLLDPREKRSMLEELNRKGVFSIGKSTIQETEQQFLTDTQKRRREAIQRAVQRKEEVAGIDRQRSTEDIDILQPRYERELGEQKKERAAGMAESQYGRKYTTHLAEAERFMK